MNGELVNPGPAAGVVRAADINDGYVIGRMLVATTPPGEAARAELYFR